MPGKAERYRRRGWRQESDAWRHEPKTKKINLSQYLGWSDDEWMGGLQTNHSQSTMDTKIKTCWT